MSEPRKEKRPWDGIDTPARTQGKCKTCGSSPENLSVETGNCWDCDDKQPQLFDTQFQPTQIHGSVHSNLTEAGIKDMANWFSEKGLDVDAAVHKRIYPSGCSDEKCWICHEGKRPVGFDTAITSAHGKLTA